MTQKNPEKDITQELLLDDLIETKETIDTSILRQRILATTRHAPSQSSKNLFWRLPSWMGGVVAAIFVFAVIFFVIPENIDQSLDKPLVIDQVKRDANNQDSDLLWDELLLIEDEIAFANL